MKTSANNFGRSDGLPILTPDSGHAFAVLELTRKGFWFPPEDLPAECGVLAKISDNTLGSRGGPAAYPQRDLIYLIEQCDVIAFDVPAAMEEGIPPSAGPIIMTFVNRLAKAIKHKGTVLTVYIDRSRRTEWMKFVAEHATHGTFVCVMDHEPMAFRLRADPAVKTGGA